MFVDTFIQRPILASVCSLVIILAGAVAIPTMPVAQYPDLAPPQVNVIAVYNGANAQAVETAVTTPLEQALNGVEGMLYMTSSSTNSGVSQITVTFDVTRNSDIAAVDVQNRVSQTLGRLPPEVRALGVNVQKNSTGFVLGAGVYAENSAYDSLFLSNYIDVYVKDALQRVPGVGQVIVFGERRYSMRLWLDPNKLANRGLTAGDVVKALQEQNVQVAAGSVGDAPAVPGQTYQISVRAEGRLADASQFNDIIVKSGAAAASLVRLSDVGRAELGAESYASSLRFQGIDAVGFAVVQLPTANALEVDRLVRAELLRLSASFPPGLKAQIAFNTTQVVDESIKEVRKTLIEAIALVVLVMFLFLQSWRSTVIPTITIPVALVGAFAFAKVMGFSINTLTLFGIILATGIVVDDAIVVIENIERHIQEDRKPAKQAASDAMREVIGAVIATALVLIAVFVPVAFFPGTTGRLYSQFSITIAFSVALSAFNAVTLTPALSGLLLDRAHHGKGMFFSGVERVIGAGTTAYVAALRRAMRFRWVVVLLFFVGLGATVWLYRTVPRAFVPEEDAGYFITLVQAPAGSSLEHTGTIARQAEQVLLKEPDIEGVFSVMGFSFSGAASNQGLIFSSLKPFAQRRGTAHELKSVLGRIMGPLFGISGAIVVPFAPPSIPGLGNFGGFEFQVLDQSGGDINALAAATFGMVGAGNSSPVLTGLFSSFSANDPQLNVEIDRVRALALGVPLSEITSAMQIFIGSQYVNDFDFNNRAYRVYVQADKAFRAEPAALNKLYVRTLTGQMLPLGNVVRIKETTAPQVINHFNLFRSATINGSARPGFSSGQALQEMDRVAKQTLPAGMSYAWSGLSYEESKAGQQQFLIFGLGLLLVYLTLAAQYESLILPFIVLLGVPLAVFGALSAVSFRGYANDVYAQIGLLVLVGLAAKNAILIVEFAEQLRERGASVLEAAIEASRLRLRPILMTSLAFILGVLPLVFATGAGREARNSVGTAVSGGMLVSTFLNLIFIPVLYVVVQTVRGVGRRNPAAEGPTVP